MTALLQLSLAYRECYQQRAKAVDRFQRSYSNSYSKYKLQRISKLEYDQRVQTATARRDQALHNAAQTYEKAKEKFHENSSSV